MQTSSVRAPDPHPGRAWLKPAVVIPVAVIAAIGGLIAWSSWPVIRPAREVTVVQAVFDRASGSAAAAPVSAEDEALPNPRGSSREWPTVQAAGWLEGEPFYVAAVALADGIVESVDALEGEWVEEGQVVARLVAEDSEIRFRRAKAELVEAGAMLAHANAELKAARAAWDEPVRLEQRVATGRAALAESEAELAQLPSLIDSARATLTRLEEEAARVRQSNERGATTELELIAAEQRAIAQRADVAALVAREQILEARIERQQADLRAAERDFELRIEDRLRLERAQAGLLNARAAVDRATAIRDEARLELDRMEVRAPIAGYVQRRLKVPGDKVIRMMDSPHSGHVLHLYDPSRIQVRVDVPLADASNVFDGQACEVVVEVLPDRVFHGEVLRVTHHADVQKNTLEVKVKVLEPDPMLRPEMLTRVKFLPPDQPSAGRGGSRAEPAERVVIPASVVGDAGDSARLWVVTDRRNGRGTLSARDVTIVNRADGWATVEGRIAPGALIAVDPQDPREGEIVSIRASSTNAGETQEDAS